MKADLGVPGPAPVLVLGVGNLLKGDAAVGLRLLELLRENRDADANVEFLDGGTRGAALLPYFAGRRGLLLLDTMALGGRPGQVHHLTDSMAFAGAKGDPSHAGSWDALLAAAARSGHCPGLVALVGVEPEDVNSGIHLSERVEKALPGALHLANRILDDLLSSPSPEQSPCAD